MSGGHRLALAAAALAALGAAPLNRCGIGDGRVAVPAGDVALGEDGDGVPGRRIHVAAFAIDRHEVTNRQFAAFVAATGHVTRAEREGGGAVFVAPTQTVGLDDASRWWRYVRGANWRHPTGPGSDLAGAGDRPVVQVALEDARAYARWTGGALPDEAQWERAARGGDERPRDPLSWAYDDAGHPTANVWTGPFPLRDTGEDGFAGMAPVGCFHANGFGLADMIGNVWEWTATPHGSAGLIKGGSFLCATNYCANFRPAAWQAQERDLGTSHIGFRTIAVPPAAPPVTPRAPTA